jgi:hypothetical protein
MLQTWMQGSVAESKHQISFMRTITMDEANELQVHGLW